MDEDDMDFTPSQNTSSNLASLFGFNKKSLQGNPSLTYTAPKAPKGDSQSPAKKEPSEEKSKSLIIISKAVQAFKLENQNYVSQGLTGVVISGNHDSYNYEIILYKPSKEYLSKTKISRNFTLTISPSNYASFYDNNKINWCMKFQSQEDVEQFATKTAICKFFAHQELLDSILIQDLTPVFKPLVDSSNTVNVVYSVHRLSAGEPSKFKEETQEKIKLSDYTFPPLSEGLIGCSENSKRVIIVPHSLVGSWTDESNPNTDVMFEVKLEKIIPDDKNSVNAPKVSEGRNESSLDSSTEETSIKARGVSIKEALTSTKSQRANLISRMARMGQATLPLRQSGPSDSEEENIITSSPKPRLPRNRNTGNSSHQNATVPQSENSQTQQVSVYQNDSSWQQSQLAKVGVAYQQLIPVSASPVSTPNNDPNLSVFVSESRVQATELRMGISKISEKLDLVWNKLQNLNASHDFLTHQSTLTDSVGILKSVQTLITENEVLKAKVDEQKGKIEQQNDRIFQLLELNHKYLEQNSSSHEKQSENEMKLKVEIESLRKRDLQLKEEAEKSRERIKELEESLVKREEEKISLAKRTEELLGEVEKYKRDMEKIESARKEADNKDEKMSKAVEKISELRDKLKETLAENEHLKSVILNQKQEMLTGKEEMGNLKQRNEEFEKEVEGLKRQISIEESKSASKIDELSQVLEKSEKKYENLQQQMENKNEKKATRDLMLRLCSKLRESLSPDKQHSTADVLSAIEKYFEEITGCSSNENKSSVEKPAVVPAPRTSKQNVEPEKKEAEEITENVKSSVENSKGNKESDSRYKSYDQGWRTAKPPPPLLYDDEDDDDDWLN